MPTQTRTISHTGTTLEASGADAVTLSTNQISPQRETEIAEFECPENFDRINYVADRDAVRFEPRTHEDHSGETDGTQTRFQVNANIQPVNGEPNIEDQQYPVVEASVNGNPVEIEQVHYADNKVDLASAPDAGDSLHLYPIIGDGTLKMFGRNNLGQPTAPLFPYGFPLYRWHDMRQRKRGQEINLSGSITWKRNETLVIVVDSGTEVVWEHSEYPGAYVSALEIDVQITF